MVHERPDIDEGTKFTYLNQCIKGLARQYLTGLKGQASDYETAVISFKQHNGDEKKVTRTLIRKLIQLESPKYNKRDMLHFELEIDNTLNQLEHHPRVNIQGGSWLIEESLMLKFPGELSRWFIDFYKSMYYTVSQIKGLNTLVDFMGADKTLGIIIPEVNQKKVTLTKPITIRPDDSNQVPKRNNTAASIGTYSITVGWRSCFFCKQDHKSYDCTQYNTLPAREDKLKEMSRCQKCIKAHDTNECTTVLGANTLAKLLIFHKNE
ncbi:uncharacterized protein LOC143027997 [Oratosquilla oratoria]|uniref:uncharacterized protein LOC143027997 n=1 Tax=Oratosquilla oratoria TaxID=337810 RepID=UPI003F75940D